MKWLTRQFYKLTLRNYDDQIKSAKMTTSMIVSSTNGKINHFYNIQGDKIRGWEGKTYHYPNEMHPLVKQYY